MNRIRAAFAAVWALTVFLGAAGQAFANPEQVKLYKAVFGDKPKCISCHVDKLPKKADGKHEFNDYGKTLRAIQETPDEETYKKVGKNEAAVVADSEEE